MHEPIAYQFQPLEGEIERNAVLAATLRGCPTSEGVSRIVTPCECLAVRGFIPLSIHFQETAAKGKESIAIPRETLNHSLQTSPLERSLNFWERSLRRGCELTCRPSRPLKTGFQEFHALRLD